MWIYACVFVADPQNSLIKFLIGMHNFYASVSDSTCLKKIQFIDINDIYNIVTKIRGSEPFWYPIQPGILNLYWSVNPQVTLCLCKPQRPITRATCGSMNPYLRTCFKLFAQSLRALGHLWRTPKHVVRVVIANLRRKGPFLYWSLFVGTEVR